MAAAETCCSGINRKWPGFLNKEGCSARGLSVGAELGGELPFQVLPFHKMSREHMISYPNVRIYTTNFNTIY